MENISQKITAPFKISPRLPTPKEPSSAMLLKKTKPTHLLGDHTKPWEGVIINLEVLDHTQANARISISR